MAPFWWISAASLLVLVTSVFAIRFCSKQPNTTSISDQSNQAKTQQSEIATPNNGTSNIITPNNGTSNIGTSHIGTPNNGTSNIGTSNIGTSHIGTSNIGTPSITTPNNGTPNIGTSHIGTSNIGTPNIGTSHIGTSNIPTFDLSGAGLTHSAFPMSPFYNVLTEIHPSLYFPRHNRWTLGAGVLQNQSGMGYSINPDFSSYVHKNYLKRMQEGESNMGAIQTGFWAAYAINKKFSVFAGLNYAQRNARQQFSFEDEVPVTLMPGQIADKFGNYPIIGYFNPSDRTEYTGFSRLTVLELPVGVMFTLPLTPKWTLRPTLGLNFGRITAETGNTLDYQLLSVTALKQEWFRKHIVTPTASLGVARKLSDALQFGVLASSGYSVTPVYVSGATVKPRAWTVGFGTQLIWTLK